MKLSTLAEAFGDNAPKALLILGMRREALERLVGETHYSIPTHELILQALNDLGDDKGPFHGVEVFDTPDGPCLYLNAGDAYATTLVHFRGKFRVTTWGDIAEKYGTE